MLQKDFVFDIPKLFTVTYNFLDNTLAFSFPLFQKSSLIVPISLLLLLQTFRAYFMVYTVWQASPIMECKPFPYKVTIFKVLIYFVIA